MIKERDVIVAGHICLDVIPTLPHLSGGLDQLLVPGKLVDTGPAMMSTGGTVSNTGLALHRLGVNVGLMGKIGDDLFGRAVLDVLQHEGDGLAEGMIISEGEQTSYTIVINPPGIDRIFLHCPGANDSFQAADVRMEQLAGARLFHFGYPPLMKRMYEHRGAELAELLRRVKDDGVTTSLDMAKPDPDSEAGRVEWLGLLEHVLPYVDVFLPSFDELLYMLDRDTFTRFSAQAGEMSHQATGELLGRLSERLLDMGTAVVAIKLGENGLYLRTTSDMNRLKHMGAARPQEQQAWLNREMLVDCYDVQVAGTTGAGDCTIAGLLTALLKGMPPEQALQSAVATGACNVERADAVSGIPKWEAVQARIAAGWEKRGHQLKLPDWRYISSSGVWVSTKDVMFS